VQGRDPRGRVGGEDGQGTVEYGLLIATGALLTVAAMLFLAGGVDTLFRKSGNEVGVFRPPVGACDASYEGACIPPAPPDLSCDDLAAMGVPLPLTVAGGDPHHFDEDGDGLACAP